MLVRPIRFTDHLPAFRELLTALGGTPVVEADGWVVFALDSGRVALHTASHEKPSGTTALGFEVADLDHFVAAGRAAGVDVSLQQEGPIRWAAVRGPGGMEFTVETAAPPVGPRSDTGRRPGLAVLPLWYTPDTAPPRELLTRVGAQPRITSNDANWSDFACADGGLIAVHGERTVSVCLSFEYDGDLDALAERLTGRGVRGSIIDESYSRVLLIPDPDGGPELWINERQRDLYGYTAAPGTAAELPG